MRQQGLFASTVRRLTSYDGPTDQTLPSQCFGDRKKEVLLATMDSQSVGRRTRPMTPTTANGSLAPIEIDAA